MKPIKTEATLHVATLGGCDDLPYAKGDGFVSTYWVPSEEDLAALNVGIPLRISWLGNIIVPISVEVEAL